MTELTVSSPRSRLAALIAEARRRGRRRKIAFALTGLALVAGGVWAGLSVTGGSPAQPPPVPAGFHAVRAEGTIQHELLATWSRSAGNGRPYGQAQRTRQEVWFDQESSLIRTRVRLDGRVHDDAYRCECLLRYPFERYWPVDTTRFVRRPGTGMFHGREVIWLGKRLHGFAPYNNRDGEWIALDPRTHAPLASRLYTTTGAILAESWVLKRFGDISPDRFWFVLRNKPLGS